MFCYRIKLHLTHCLMSILALLSGTLLLMITIYDFVFTTLSGGGSGFISRNVHLLSHKILKTGARIIGRKLYNQSGIFLNGLLISVWVVLIWLGLFLVYSFQPEAIVNDDGRAASNIERFYFTGYTYLHWESEILNRIQNRMNY